jgi:hypothetical protein
MSEGIRGETEITRLSCGIVMGVRTPWRERVLLEKLMVNRLVKELTL